MHAAGAPEHRVGPHQRGMLGRDRDLELDPRAVLRQSEGGDLADVDAPVADRRAGPSEVASSASRKTTRSCPVGAQHRRIGEADEPGGRRTAARRHLDVRAGQQGIEAGHLADADPRLDDPELRAFARQPGGGLVQLDHDVDVLQIGIELDRLHAADLDAAIDHLGARGDVGAIGKVDLDGRADVDLGLIEQVGADRRGDDRHEPDIGQVQAPALAHGRLGSRGLGRRAGFGHGLTLPCAGSDPVRRAGRSGAARSAADRSCAPPAGSR